MQLEEVSHSKEESEKPSYIEFEDVKINVKNLNAFWDKKQEEPCLKAISFALESGELLTVVGPVGSGKSSLLLATLKEIHVLSDHWLVQGKISYASQEPWLFNSSVRENILFGKPFEPKKYREVMAVTTLDRDMKILHYGDMTLVGERGINLSGGQRARVSLAR